MQTTTPQLDPDAMRAAATAACGLLKSLSHPARLLLLCQLVRGEACVSALEQATGIAQPSLSQQLGLLREDGLVETRRAGKQIYYRLASREAQAVLELIYSLYCPTTTRKSP